jgi:YVTN family beta-propeller protein
MRFPVVLIIAATILCPGCRAGADDPPASDTHLKLINTVDLPAVEGRIDHFALDEKGRRLFMAALGSDAVVLIDLQTAKVTDQIKSLATPQGVAFSAKHNLLAVANDKDGTCRLFDAATLKEKFRADLKDDADNVRWDETNNCFWVGYGEGALASIDPKTSQKIADIKLEGHPESFQLETKSDRIFVNVPHSNQIAVIDRKKSAVIDKWPLQSAHANFPMALDEANHRLFIGCRQPARLIVLNTQTGKEIASVDCVGDTDDVFYDAKTHHIYVIGGEGAIDVIKQSDADHYRATTRIKTAPGARTAYFAPSENNLYVAIPHRGIQKAQLCIYKVLQ